MKVRDAVIRGLRAAGRVAEDKSYKIPTESCRFTFNGKKPECNKNGFVTRGDMT